MTDVAIAADPPHAARPGLAALGLAALGVVFGDIGTSPLYTFKIVLGLAGDKPDPAMVLGSLSLIVWTLILITSVKYVSIAMRVDNDGEGGILALMALIGLKRQHRPAIVALGLFGAALIYGDGAITPAISVLSALEGLQLATPALQPVILPAAVAILVALFAIQPLGTARIGRAFGPLMAVWFIVIALLGFWGIAQHPSVLAALNPWHGIVFLFAGGAKSFLVLGGVFLCVTGAEALYADMGHFGPRPIRVAWLVFVFPALVLNYAGQAALVLDGAPVGDSIFYQLCPPMLLIPLLLLATVATIIASQSIITGAFSMTRQAIQLGWLPRLQITQTSEEGYGQIYVGAVNWLLMIVTLALTIGFGKSDNLASAYGIAVAVTMLMTSALLFIAMREIWQWSLPLAGVVAGIFLIIDAAFAAANLQKFAEGGYVPVLLAAAVYAVMWIWHTGVRAMHDRVEQTVMPIEALLTWLAERKIPRVPGSAVFLTRTLRHTPPVLVWHLKHNRALHQHVVVITAVTELVPSVGEERRLELQQMAPQFWRLTAHYGFMERPDLPELLRQAAAAHCEVDLSDVTYYVGHETVVASDDAKRLPRLVEALFAAMQRNAARVTEFYRLPRESVVEIGREISI
ncbi:MAG TPA: KUP/HAK/KT family potassium transporter [Stellaceae bacterium]|jgi:KUP system potassium uptake protein|nr:KUP/HAK/KT family potassium transporter [Stellaceae bacterium]